MLSESIPLASPDTAMPISGPPALNYSVVPRTTPRVLHIYSYAHPMPAKAGKGWRSEIHKYPAPPSARQTNQSLRPPRTGLRSDALGPFSGPWYPHMARTRPLRNSGRRSTSDSHGPNVLLRHRQHTCVARSDDSTGERADLRAAFGTRTPARSTPLQRGKEGAPRP